MEDILRKRASDRHAALMDRVYRSQSGIYDLTRKYYLLGRDQLIEALAPPAGGRVLEIGCGTARNLVQAAKVWPDAEFYGFDISSEMLKVARKNLAHSGMKERITLFHGDAENPALAMPLAVRTFDRIFLSFCLSMIPDWQGAIRQALTLLAPGGELHIVDFGQSEQLPAPFRSLLQQWLALFHVTPRKHLGAFLAELDSEIGTRSEFVRQYRGYSWRFVVRLPAKKQAARPKA
ncbi:MAG: class I SAM-dependent methyltransferase [Sphingomonadales bacterium]|nr:class I SAM-dependent methyltransferase [Sphingomonadales bacterium]PIX67521.1 MAG: SAM-dependent methyltransferase [Sphingomonadales bacterium CG_4_10_14_3_um_filter_58_15]NCO49504.1 class I SAM-dependent methyltransferase [Sphingomonadales bacterium]NCO99022.1 class I SAM-dependent methyltransferase [Sphingomonadales bacterium]NCP26595.1 class I SAM-dependent methyltransferase [Sphingomonadales bacterium]